MASYDRIGAGYDATRRADPYLTSRLAHWLNLKPGERCLDVACGTGNYTTTLARAGLSLTGLDISRRMLAGARAKDADAGWVHGDAAALPFRSASFDGAVCTLALHHFPALEPAFCEVYRVLRRGRFVIFTGDHAQMEGVWLREYFPALIRQAIEIMPSADRVTQALRTADFAEIQTELYEVRDDLQDLFMFSGKHRPELYLDLRVRAGISSFAIADPIEVDAGCQRLAADIRSGRIAEVMAAARHPFGDYTFIIATKL